MQWIYLEMNRSIFISLIGKIYFYIFAALEGSQVSLILRRGMK